MKITIVATHSFPIPYKTHTGDIVILDLAKSLQSLGHDVALIAPYGTDFNNLLPMQASYGKYPPSSEECEDDAFYKYKDILLQQDIVHDFSVSKRIVVNLNNMRYFNTVSTILGGAWKQQFSPRNLCVWSKSHRNRVLRGATDYENTPTPDLAGANGTPVEDAHVVYGGIDTNFYCPSDYKKEGYFLWMNRWHPAKGYKLAIELAKKYGFELVLAGEHPDNELFEFQRNCALEAMNMSIGVPNIRFQFLPEDPDHHIAKRDLYRKAKALLYTVQFHEPFGLSQVEALSCGTPVIGTNYGSVPELINRTTGFVCENDVNDFGHAISAISKVAPEHCRRYATQRFDKKIFAKSYLEEYKNVINGCDW